MAFENSPSSVMYAELKAVGISNRDVAITLMDTERNFGGSTLMDRIDSRTRLSRDIVHVGPGDLSPTMFKDFEQSAQVLTGMIIGRMRKSGIADAAQAVADRFAGESAQAMLESLQEYGLDASLYRNALNHIDNLNKASAADRALLYVMLFVVVGCMGDPLKGAQAVEHFSANRVGASFKTTEADFEQMLQADEPDEDLGNDALGLARIVGGRLKGADGFYRLSTDEAGSEIGTLASGPCAITDVDEDVSRHHARIYKRGGHWYIIGLKSTNGTTVISGDDKMEHVVEPPKRGRDRNYVPEPFEILPTDTICLGASTRFMVMPIL